MRAIVLFSHGSVLCGAERNLLELAAFMRERGDAPIVEIAFLNYLPPDLSETIARCISLGATSVTTSPYFLVAGKFVTDDLPVAIARVREEHPALPMMTADVIGFHPAMVDAVIGAIATARSPFAWSDERMAEAGSACRENPRCPLYGSAVCRVAVEVLA